jgi:CubicO group peptidase (beta-lactamase class C family)
MMKRKIYFILFLLITAAANAQQHNYKEAVFTDNDRITRISAAWPVLDKLFTTYADYNHFPAFVYGVVVDGKVVHTFSYGYLNENKKIAAAPTSVFRIASMTKSFTAMSILKLRDEGKLRLDDPAYLYIPELKQQHYPTKDASDITIRNLLIHGAGFPEDNPWGDRQLANTNQELIDLVKGGINFSNDPGQTFEYSNLGFTLLGYIIKKVSGLSYEDYITKNILAPLGMTHTYWEYTNVPENELALGYKWYNGQFVQQEMLHDGAYGAMGGMMTSIEDFSKYVALHISAWPPRDDKETGPVKRSSIREMQFPWNFGGLNMNNRNSSGEDCPVVSAYGYGLGWSKYCDGKVYVGHSGGLPGFGSQWRILPEYGIGIISFANLTYAPAGGFNAEALDTLIKIAHLQPRQLPPSDILTERRNELVKVLEGWEHAKSNPIFAMNFFKDYPIEVLKDQTAKAFEKAGSIIKVDDVVPENQLRGYFIMEGEHANIKVRFTLTPEHEPKIQEFHINPTVKN